MGSKDSNIRPFNSSNAPQPGGHYSQAMIYNGTIYISGQLPINPFTGEKISGGIEEQTTQVLENIRTILKDAGSSLSKVVKTTVYVSDISLWGKGTRYMQIFGNHKPARAVVPTRNLHHGFLVEIEVIAAL
ncbi:MAG: Rid family detoxifying hydrolase [Bacteroidales bacterium]